MNHIVCPYIGIICIRSAKRAAVRLKPWNGDLSIKRDRTMTVLTYRGKKYTQNKEFSKNRESVLLTYRGLEIMSKRIHEAATAEMG